jgi:CubicO group peptidase (beta-lactamase class C family)
MRSNFIPMIKSNLLPLLCLFLFVSSSASAQGWQDTVRAIETLFARYTPENPGCELAISRNGQVIYSKAWGMADLEHRAPMTTTSISEAGSVSKQITAAAILLLEQQGKLSLDDDVRKYIPELPDYGHPILIKYMMHHTSGIRDWGAIAALSGWPRTTKTYNNNDALDIIVHQHRLNNIPNDRYIYSNSNYNLLAIIVQRVSGMSLADFTREYIFKPAGMTHTSWRDDHKRVVPDRAIAYAQHQGIYETNMPNEDTYGHGSLLTTAEDLLKWNAYYLSGRFGKPSLLPKQLATESLNNGQDNLYAAGLFIRQRHHQTNIAHDGVTAGYRAFLSAYPDMGLSFAWLSNTSAFDGAQNITQQVEDIFFGDEKYVSAVKEAVKPSQHLTRPTAELQPYEGKYYSDEVQAAFTVLLKDSNLYLYRSPQTMIALYPAPGKDHFATDPPGFSGEPGEIVFISGKDGIKEMQITIDRAIGVSFARLP